MKTLAKIWDAHTFGADLRKFRDKLGLNQAEAAAFLEVSKRIYCTWESGEGSPLAITMEGAIARLEKKLIQEVKKACTVV